MAYRVKTRKEFNTIPSSTTIFSSGTTHDKWTELNTAGKIVSYTMDKINDTVYEETMTFDTYDSFIQFSMRSRVNTTIRHVLHHYCSIKGNCVRLEKSVHATFCQQGLFSAISPHTKNLLVW